MSDLIKAGDYKEFIKTIKYMRNWYPLFIKGQQVVAQLENIIGPQAVDEIFQIPRVTIKRLLPNAKQFKLVIN